MKTIAILVFLIASTVCVNAEIITHSHCVNHYKNNTENMHTHDVDFSNDAEAAEHRAKHTVGHPHTWEFDGFCPKGTERNKQKRKPLNPTPPNGDDGNPTENPIEKEADETGTAERDTYTRTDTPIVSTTPRQVDTPITNVLRITRVSFAEVRGRGRVRTYATLTLEITAVAPETAHNGLIIVVNDTSYRTSQNFFGEALMGKDDMRRVTLMAKPANAAVFLKVQSPKNSRSLPVTQREWRVIENFDITNFTLAIQDSSGTRDRITHADIDTGGNRRGYTAGAPSLRKPRLTTMWASLKQRK